MSTVGWAEAPAGPPVEKSHVRHILIKTSEIVSSDEARRKLLDLRQRIVLGHESFAKLARRFSLLASHSPRNRRTS